ncbi:hypothetical protein IHN63_00725 [Deinococcus sp. 6YEL10]|uniref:hypothetical protein n=1 Tax=Deinococcus sp. 6YEL10 TaxID=2745870 RepID=UPI001E3B396A|nr:hypothetical protein [Deinococcus sp. 6YEL10]MCD0159821.1 hypothetical protein [Deinococcus sp. 6YEL10]
MKVQAVTRTPARLHAVKVQAVRQSIPAPRPACTPARDPSGCNQGARCRVRASIDPARLHVR